MFCGLADSEMSGLGGWLPEASQGPLAASEALSSSWVCVSVSGEYPRYSLVAVTVCLFSGPSKIEAGRAWLPRSQLS